MTDTGKNLPSLRDQRSDIGTAHRAGKLLTRVAEEVAKHLPSGAVPDANSLTPNTETQTSPLSVAEIVLQRAAESRHPRELALGELKATAGLAEREAPGNPYSEQLMNVVEMLEQGNSVEQVLAKVQEALGSRK